MKYFPQLVTSIALTSIALLQSGCATVNTIEPAQTVGTRHIIADRRVITDQPFDRAVNIVGINTATVNSGFLKIQVELVNRSSFTQEFSYQVEWFDANGMVVNTPMSPWIDRQIQGGETLDISRIAPTETAKDFRIKFISK